MNRADRDFSAQNQRIKTLLKNACAPLILSHVRPDGDAVGSMLGFFHALKSTGKNTQMVLVDGVPKRYRFIQDSNQVGHKVDGQPDLIIALDCADQKRIGPAGNGLEIDINIDHHITNQGYGRVNIVDSDQPATTAIITKHLHEWGLTLNENAANALLMGLVTDTIGFRTSNVKPETMRIASILMENGGKLDEIYLNALTSQSFAAGKVWGLALERMHKDDRLVWTTITLKDREISGYGGRDDADLTNQLSAIVDTDVSILFNEQKDGLVKVSWRSNNANIDVSQIAVRFGGGGHPPAAGAEIPGQLPQVIELVTGETKQLLKGKNQAENDRNE